MRLQVAEFGHVVSITDLQELFSMDSYNGIKEVLQRTKTVAECKLSRALTAEIEFDALGKSKLRRNNQNT